MVEGCPPQALAWHGLNYYCQGGLGFPSSEATGKQPHPGLDPSPPRASWQPVRPPPWEGSPARPSPSLPRPGLAGFAETWLGCSGTTSARSPGWALLLLPLAHSSGSCGPLPRVSLEALRPQWPPPESEALGSSEAFPAGGRPTLPWLWLSSAACSSSPSSRNSMLGCLPSSPSRLQLLPVWASCRHLSWATLPVLSLLPPHPHGSWLWVLSCGLLVCCPRGYRLGSPWTDSGDSRNPWTCMQNVCTFSQERNRFVGVSNAHR